MFCPQCGQEKVSDETTYCSRCGFLLVAVNDLLQTGGVNPLALSTSSSASQSPRKRGLKQGLFLFLLTFLVAPLMGMISLALKVEPIGVGIAVIVCLIGGLLRMVYALMFESVEPGLPTLEEKILVRTPLAGTAQHGALPPQSVPVSEFAGPLAGAWRDTSELQPSVTENTTKLLDNNETPQ